MVSRFMHLRAKLLLFALCASMLTQVPSHTLTESTSTMHVLRLRLASGRFFSTVSVDRMDVTRMTMSGCSSQKSYWSLCEQHTPTIPRQGLLTDAACCKKRISPSLQLF